MDQFKFLKTTYEVHSLHSLCLNFCACLIKTTIFNLRLREDTRQCVSHTRPSAAEPGLRKVREHSQAGPSSALERPSWLHGLPLYFTLFSVLL